MAAVATGRARQRWREAHLKQLATAIGSAAEGAGPAALRPFRDGDLRDVVRAIDVRLGEAAAERAELTRDRTRLSAVLSGMVEGVLVVNASGDVELINRAAQQCCDSGHRSSAAATRR
jgi:signal transduction histidine kinase